MRKNKAAIIVIALAVLLMCSPLLLNNHALLGVDGYFQYNRIYEAALQLKNHNFSFINLYSFQQAGRVVNSLYSPLITYVAGGLLLLVGNWFRFQILTLFIVYFVSGYVMYAAGRRLGFSKRVSIALGVIFLSSNVVYGFIFGVTWRSIAFGLLPLLVGPILDLYAGDWQLLSMLKLGVFIGLLAQFQILTVALVLPLLVPFFIRGLWHSKFNLNGLLNFFAGVLLALLLSLNTLLPLLEVYRGNTLISPVAMDLVPNASLILQPIYNGVASNSDIVLTMIAYAMLTGLIVFWTRLGAFTKLFSCVALVYILIGTGLFPWDSIQKLMPYLQSFLQMPRRISLVGTPFMMLATVMIYQDVAVSQKSAALHKGIVIAGTFLSLLSLLLCTQKVAQNVHYTITDTTPLAAGLQTADDNVHSNLKYIKQLQPAFHTRHINQLIKQVDRTTPDYIPVTQKIETHSNVYRAYRRNFSVQQSKFKHQVIHNGIQLTWNAKHTKMRALPVVAYRRTVLTLNGHRVTSEQIKHHWIGNLSLKQRRGKNVLTVRYEASRVTTLGTKLALIAWVGVLVAGPLLVKRARRFLVA